MGERLGHVKRSFASRRRGYATRGRLATLCDAFFSRGRVGDVDILARDGRRQRCRRLCVASGCVRVLSKQIIEFVFVATVLAANVNVLSYWIREHILSSFFSFHFLSFFPLFSNGGPTPLPGSLYRSAGAASRALECRRAHHVPGRARHLDAIFSAARH